jgi:lysophospholipase L1-like esterase
MLRLLALLLAVTGFAADVAKPAAFSSPKFDKDIAAFEAADKANPPPRNAVLFSGASTFRRWKTLAEAFKDHPVINRGFGGSKTTEVLGFMDRITLPYHPRVVVFHCGSNDLAAGDTAEAVAGRVRSYLGRLRKEDPECALILLSTTHAPSRRKAWDAMKQTDRLFQQIAKDEKGVTYVDINPALNLPDGEPRPGVYAADALHPTDLGYEGIRALVSPALEQAWKNTATAFTK